MSLKLVPFESPAAAQPYVVQKVDMARKRPGPWTRTWSNQYLSAVHPVTCSLLWVRCLFEQQKLRKMTPKVIIFENVFPDLSTRLRITFRGQIWWKSAVAKLLKGRLDYHTQKLELRGTRPSPHFAQNVPIAPKIPWTLSPFDPSTYTKFGQDRLRFAGLISERLIFFGPKSKYQ